MRKITRFVAGALIALLPWSLPAFAEGAPKKYLSAATTNSTLVMTGARGVLLKTLVMSNSTATAYYLKLYNKATAPTCGTDAPVKTIGIPAGASIPVSFGEGDMFPLGIGFCLTGAIADADTTAAATGIAINFSVSGR